MKIVLRIDPRIRPAFEYIESVRKNFKPGTIFSLKDVIPKDGQLEGKVAAQMLVAYGIIRQGKKRGTVSRTPLRTADFAQIYRELTWLLWLLTSRGYSEAKVFESSESLKSWLRFFGAGSSFLEGHRLALKLIDYARRYKSGLSLNLRNRFQEPVPSKIEEQGQPIQLITKESMLYEPIRDFLRAHRFKREGFDYTGWSQTFIADDDLRKRTGEIGDWGNPDLFSYRIDTDAVTDQHQLETMAIEVKKKEHRVDGKWVNIHFKKSWVAQAQSYHRFANLVYLAINTTLDRILERPIILRYMIDSRVGLLLLRDTNDLASWWEVIPPAYTHPRASATNSMLAHIMKKQSVSTKVEPVATI